MSVAHAASHDRKRIRCDFFWRILLITQGCGRMKSQRARTNLGVRETLGFCGFSPDVVAEVLGRDEEDSGLDILA